MSPSDCTYADRVERAMVAFYLDAQSEWVAELACGHHQHVRHQPPFHLRPWVLGAEGRQQRLGTPLRPERAGARAIARRGRGGRLPRTRRLSRLRRRPRRQSSPPGLRVRSVSVMASGSVLSPQGHPYVSRAHARIPNRFCPRPSPFVHTLQRPPSVYVGGTPSEALGTGQSRLNRQTLEQFR
jgi:hypothetical protein